MAPRPNLLTNRALEMIENLPVVLRGDPDYQAIMYCVARQVDAVDDMLRWTRDQANPLTADARGLGWWEALLKVAPIQGDLLESRRARVVDRFRSLAGDPSTADWVKRVSQRLNGQPWRWESYLPEAMRFRNLAPAAYGNTTAWPALAPAGATRTMTTDPTNPLGPTSPVVRLQETGGLSTGLYIRRAGTWAPDGAPEAGAIYTIACLYKTPNPGTMQLGLTTVGSTATIVKTVSRVNANLDWQIDYAQSQIQPGATGFTNINSIVHRVANATLDVAGIALYKGSTPPTLRRFFDGSNANATWTGTPNASPSQEGTPVPEKNIRVFLPTSPTSPEWAAQTAAIRDETPSEINLIFASLAGFLLDASRMDLDAMTI